MREARLLQVLLSPHVSEKTARVGEKNRQIVFKVRPDANKQEIKDAVELVFKVNVISVQVLNVKGKRKNFGRIPGKRVDWKKAYVRLQEGQDIEFGNQ